MSVADRPDLFFTDLVRDPKGVIDRTVKSGFSNRALADTAAWAWEMAAQVEAVAAQMGIPCLFIGGGGAQLRFDVALQRGSADADFLIRATRQQVAHLIERLAERLVALEPPPFFVFEIHEPRGNVKPLPMVRYNTTVPDLGGGKPHGHIIKLEFSLRNDRLPAAEEITATLFPFAAPVRHQVPLLPYQIAMKLMTVTSEAAGGVPTRRQSVLPRQFYDLDGLFGVVRRDQWRDIASGVADLALRETRPVRSSDVWTGIQARLAEWAEGAERSRTVEIGAFSNEIRTGQRIPLSGWRTRCRRLAYAARCAEAGDAGAWVEATRIVAVLTKRDLPRIEARWRSERGTSPPRMGDTSAAALWWEYLATGGLPTPPR